MSLETGMSGNFMNNKKQGKRDQQASNNSQMQEKWEMGPLLVGVGEINPVFDVAAASASLGGVVPVRLLPGRPLPDVNKKPRKWTKWRVVPGRGEEQTRAPGRRQTTNT